MLLLLAMPALTCVLLLVVQGWAAGIPVLLRDCQAGRCLHDPGASEQPSRLQRASQQARV
jgi:hypothetical protein